MSSFSCGYRVVLGSDPLFQALAPAAGFLFMALTMLLWRVGERRYASTGS